MTDLDVTTSPVLEVRDLVSGYGGSRVLNGVDLTIAQGECVAILGRNGMGKSTLINTIIGWVRPMSGAITFKDSPIAGASPESIVRAGIGIVPQGRRVIPTLTVRENLAIAERRRQGANRWTVDDAIALFPRLGERANNLGHQLSGGEQQMVAIARALLCNPDLLLMDEPSDGLAPTIVHQIAGAVQQLLETGLTVVLVEQDLASAFALASRVAVMEKGRIVLDVTTSAFRADSRRARSLLGLSG